MKRNNDESWKHYIARRKLHRDLDIQRRKGRLFWDSSTLGTLCKQPREGKTHRHEIDAYWGIVKMVRERATSQRPSSTP